METIKSCKTIGAIANYELEDTYKVFK